MAPFNTAPADRGLGDFDAEAAMRVELEALGVDDLCSDSGSDDSVFSTGARTPAVVGGDVTDAVDDVRRAWTSRAARLLQTHASNDTENGGTSVNSRSEESDAYATPPEERITNGSRDAASCEERNEDCAYGVTCGDTRTSCSTETHAAATRIQSLWRGEAVRNRLKRLFLDARYELDETLFKLQDECCEYDGVAEAFYMPPPDLFLDPETVDTAVEHLEKLTAVEFHTFPDVRHEAVSQMRYANPSASDETRSDDEDETRVYVSSPHASSTERRLAASATEWGFPRKSAVEEAFLRHRAKLHVEAKRRERREAMKDPTRRLQRLKASEAKNETSRRNI